MVKTFTAYNDPSHGWVKVKRSLLEELGIGHQISSYSYQRGDYVYLEEDSDATLFIEAMRRRDIEPIIVDKYTNKFSHIRSYEHYVPLTHAERHELNTLKKLLKERINEASLHELKYWKDVKF